MNMRTLTTVLVALCVAGPLWAAPGDSKRLGRAKDFIADEQWLRAVTELKAVVADPKERNRAEALYWLAHSEYQAGDNGAAIETIARLEREYPSSVWVRPARSLRIEIAQRLRRDDLLWWMATPPPPPIPPTQPTPAAAPVPPAMPVATTPVPPRPAASARALPPAAAGARPAAPPTPAAPPLAAAPPPTPVAAPPASTAPPAPPARDRMLRRGEMAVPSTSPDDSDVWVPAPFEPDTDLRIQALSGLLQAHPDRVIPLLKEIALDTANPADARRAVFVLGQSSRPDARSTIVEVAKRGPVQVRIAAIRELGRVDAPNVTSELLQVYSTASNDPRIKREVVSSLGTRADTTALLRIARTESDTFVRNTAILTLGRAGARAPLAMLYAQAPRESRSAVLSALLAAKDEDQLITIARSEKDPALRQQALRQLRLLGTPRALQYLRDHR